VATRVHGSSSVAVAHLTIGIRSTGSVYHFLPAVRTIKFEPSQENMCQRFWESSSIRFAVLFSVREFHFQSRNRRRNRRNPRNKPTLQELQQTHHPQTTFHVQHRPQPSAIICFLACMHACMHARSATFCTTDVPTSRTIRHHRFLFVRSSVRPSSWPFFAAGERGAPPQRFARHYERSNRCL